GKDAGRVPLDPRSPFSPARRGRTWTWAPLRLRLSLAEPRLRHRAELDRSASAYFGVLRECPRACTSRRADRRHDGRRAPTTTRGASAPAAYHARKPRNASWPARLERPMEDRRTRRGR